MEFKIARIRKGLSQEKLAQLAGVCRLTVCKVESGQADNVKLGLVKKIAKALDTPLSELI